MKNEKNTNEQLIEEENSSSKNSGFKKIISSSKFKHGGVATAFTAGFIVVVILINIVVSALGERFPSMNIDLTKEGTNTLSAQAQKVVSEVKTPTTIYILASENLVKNDKDYGRVGTLAKKMQEKNSNIKVEYKDLDKNPAFVNTYKSEKLQTGDVIVQTAKRYRVVPSNKLFETQYQQDGSQAAYSVVDSMLASAISQTNSEVVPIVAFATGHQEALDSTSLKGLLNNNNFETKDFNIMTDKIPEKTQIVVLATPMTDYTDAELKKIDEFLKNKTFEANKSLMITFHPSQQKFPKLAKFLAEWGIGVKNSVIIESDQSKMYMNDTSFILSQIKTEEKLSDRTDYGYVAMPQSCPIERLFENRGAVSTIALATSYESTFEVDAKSTDETIKNAKKQSFNTAVLSKEQIKIKDKYYQSSVIALGSSLMASGNFLDASTFGNYNYISDLAKYAAGTSEDKTEITVERTQLGAADMTISNTVANVLGLGIFTILIPLLILIAGMVVYLKRRHL